jgi:hypothetical protein
MKKLINKNIIKAMTIGISALMMANSMNLTAFASEGDNNTQPNNGGKNNQEDTEKSQIALLQELATEAQTDVTNAIEGEGGVQDYIENAETVSEASGLDDLADETKELKDELDDTTQIAVNDVTIGETGEIDTDTDGSNEKIDVEEAIADVITALDEINDTDTVIKADVAVIESQTEIANQAAEDADEAAKEAMDLVANKAEDGEVILLTDVTTTTLEALDEAEKNIKDADTVGEANEALGLAEAAVAAADKAVDTAEKGFVNAEAKYEAAKGIYDEAANKVAETRDALFGEGGALEKYEALKSIAIADAESAYDELGVIAGDVDSLKDAADKLAAKAEGYQQIAKFEKEIEDTLGKGKTPSWEQYRKLAKAIIKYYYVPDVLGGEIIGEIDWPDDWSSFTTKDYYGNGHKSSAADVLKYGEFSYKYIDENGEEQITTGRVNYKTAEGNTQKTQSGIVLFEKTEFETKDKNGILQTQYSNLNWYKGNLILAQKDIESYTTDEGGTVKVDPSANDDFRNRVKNFKAIAEKYSQLSQDAQAASTKLTQAQETVNSLLGQLQELCPDLGNLTLEEIADMPVEEMTGDQKVILKEFEADLSEAKSILEEAQKQKKEIDAKLEVVKAEYQAKVAELTSSGETVTAATETETPAADDAAPAPAAPAAAPAPAIIAPAALEVDGDAADIDAVSGAGEDLAQTAEIENEVAALTGTIPADEKKIYDIVNDPTALAELIEEPGVKIRAYWWILIIAALGVTGIALYRQYKKNKEAEANGGRKN